MFMYGLTRICVGTALFGLTQMVKKKININCRFLAEK